MLTFIQIKIIHHLCYKQYLSKKARQLNLVFIIKMYCRQVDNDNLMKQNKTVTLILKVVTQMLYTVLYKISYRMGGPRRLIKLFVKYSIIGEFKLHPKNQ